MLTAQHARSSRRPAPRACAEPPANRSASRPHRRRRPGGDRPGRGGHGGTAQLRPDDGVLDRRPGCGAVGHRLPQRGLLPAGNRRPSGRRPAPGLRRPDLVLAPRGSRTAAWPARLGELPPGLRPPALRHAAISPRPAEPRRALRGRRPAARRRLPRLLRRRRPARLGHRLSHPSRAPGLRARPAPEARPPGAADSGTRPGRPAALAHLPAGGDAVGQGRHRRVDPPGDLARLRQRHRALHAAARRRAGRSDVRDRGGGGNRKRATGLHPRLRDDHPAGHGGRPRGPEGLLRPPRGRTGALRRVRAERDPHGRDARSPA